MALTIANTFTQGVPTVLDGQSHGIKVVVVDCTTGAADYPAGGYPIAAAQLPQGYGLGTILGAQVIGMSANVLSTPIYNQVTSKLMFLEQGGAVAGPLREAVAADVSTSTIIRLAVWGI